MFLEVIKSPLSRPVPGCTVPRTRGGMDQAHRLTFSYGKCEGPAVWSGLFICITYRNICVLL